MEQTIQVMRHSVAEPRDDGKAIPLVGALLYRPDGTIETAARGELRNGDHAEFTLLERKHRSERLDGSILFATLEPCAPGARRHPKLGCAERIVNARIAEVYVGILDPDPDVDRKGLAYLEQHGIKIHMFDRDLQEEIREANAGFLTQALLRAEERWSEKDKTIVLSSLEEHEPEADLSDFSQKALEHYRAKIGITEGTESDVFRRRLKRQGLVVADDGGEVPSGFGLLLFGENPRDNFQQAGLLATVRYPNGKEEIRNFEEPYVLIPGLLEEWLRKVLSLTIDRNRMERGEQPEIPFEMVREAVVNALIHRDYDIKGAKCQLVIDSDAIVVKSPGEPQSPVKLEELKTFSAPMVSRNPKLHYVFAQIDAAEERGLGLLSLKKKASDLGLPLPDYSYDAPYLVLTIYRAVESVSAVKGGEALASLNKTHKSGWNWLATVGAATSTEYAGAQDVSPRTALSHLNRFVDLGLATKSGAGPSTKYNAVKN